MKIISQTHQRNTHSLQLRNVYTGRGSSSEPHSRLPAGTRKLDVLAAWATTRSRAKTGGHSTRERDFGKVQRKREPVNQQIQDAPDYRILLLVNINFWRVSRRHANAEIFMRRVATSSICKNRKACCHRSTRFWYGREGGRESFYI